MQGVFSPEDKEKVQGLKPYIAVAFYGPAKAVPFVQ